MYSRGSPNLFIISNAQSGFTANFPHMINEQSKHPAYVLKHCQERQARTLEVSEQAEADWVKTIIDLTVFRQKKFSRSARRAIRREREERLNCP